MTKQGTDGYPQPRIAVIGSVFMDCMGRPSGGHFDPKGRNVGDVSFIHGGVGRNIAEDLFHAGARVSFLSSVDDGPLGAAVTAYLNEIGMDTRHLAKGPSGMGIWMAVTDLTGEVAASISQQPDYSFLEKMVQDQGADLIAGCDVAALECDLTDGVMQEVCRISREKKKPLYCAVSNMEVVLRNKNLMQDMDTFVCNEIEMGRLLGRNLEGISNEQVVDLLKSRREVLTCKRVVVTTGARGAAWYNFEKREGGSLQSTARSVRDTSGAGDSFFAGYVFERAKGADMEAAIRTGLSFAALTIAQTGPVRADLGQQLFG